ncbi:MAG: hypothetical protein ABSH05_00795 [Bryobacteraceae bacterium]
MTESLLNILLIQVNLVLLLLLITIARVLLRRGALIALGAILLVLCLLPMVFRH